MQAGQVEDADVQARLLADVASVRSRHKSTAILQCLEMESLQQHTVMVRYGELHLVDSIEFHNPGTKAQTFRVEVRSVFGASGPVQTTTEKFPMDVTRSAATSGSSLTLMNVPVTVVAPANMTRMNVPVTVVAPANMLTGQVPWLCWGSRCCPPGCRWTPLICCGQLAPKASGALFAKQWEKKGCLIWFGRRTC